MPQNFRHMTPSHELVELDITEEVCCKVARRLRGSAGPGGSDAVAIQGWLLRYGEASMELRKANAEFTSWLANESPPWAAYRALRSGRLVALDKGPGVRPVGIGETWMRYDSKCVLFVAGGEAKDECGVDQLCAGLEAGVEGGIHALRLIWELHAQEENWGFLLVDAKNAFNEGNRTRMVWTIRHTWPSGARSVFNCYRHWAVLVVRAGNGVASFLFSKEGVTQGDPLSMVAYGLSLLPLIRQLKDEFPDVFQPWYANDAGGGEQFAQIRSYFLRLVELGPKYGYFPEPSKSILAVREHSKEAAKTYFADLGFTIVTGARYLGGFVSKDLDQTLWVEAQAKKWPDAVGVLAYVAENHPQAAYAGLQKSLQQEWQFLQRVTEGIDVEFSGIESALRTQFLPALFGKESLTASQRQLTCLPVKQAEIAISDPTESAGGNYTASTVACGHLVAALRRREEFRSVMHQSTMAEEKAATRKRNLELNSAKLATTLRRLPDGLNRTITRGKETGAWLTVLPSIVNETELSAEEFRDALIMRYGERPSNFPHTCDGCDAPFSLQHALGCKKGGLVIFRHNEVRDELAHLAAEAFTPSSVRDEPLIRSGHVAEQVKALNTKDANQPDPHHSRSSP